jgi:hypothetical protein
MLTEHKQTMPRRGVDVASSACAAFSNIPLIVCTASRITFVRLPTANDGVDVVRVTSSSAALKYDKKY